MTESRSETSAVRRAALDATRNWSCLKTEMALRAFGVAGDGRRESLDVIAASVGRSRETVRRARNELIVLLKSSAQLDADEHVGGDLPAVLVQPASGESPAAARALRRFLTMTGPLPWDEVLVAWARVGGKHPYLPLPNDLPSLLARVSENRNIHLSDGPNETVTVAVADPEQLDQVSQLLYDVLRNRPSGVDRANLFDAAEAVGLKGTTIATTLSWHPALIRLGPGRWALRGTRLASVSEAPVVPVQRKLERSRPTSFSWSNDGSLKLEFSVPRGRSPVIAVPTAIFELVENREFEVIGASKPARISVSKARLWGFGPLVADVALVTGSRAVVSLDLINSTARCGSVKQKESHE